MSARKVIWIVLCVLSSALTFGCAKQSGGVIPVVSPSPSPTAVPSVACNTNESTNPNLILIGIGSEATTVTSPYGQIAGYALFDGIDIPGQAQVISKTYAGQPITTTNTVQFTNIELGAGTIFHSAVAFAGKFPPTPYVFPSPAASPVGTVIGNSFWSTGRIPPAQSGLLCFSQEFTLEPGTYYFGDLDYYNTITSYRDVLVVQP